jgi:hypothetical protein
MRSRLSVTVPAASTALTTRAAAQAELGRSFADADVDRWILEASSEVARFMGRVLALETVTETFWLDRRAYPALRLERSPVATLSSVAVDGSALVVATEVLLDAKVGTITRLMDDTPIDWIAGKIEVSYQAGWILPGDVGANLPADIQRACNLTVVAMAEGRGRDGRLRSQSADGVSAESYLDPRAADGALPWEAAAILRPLALTVFG